jgi:hypothetical protein
MLNILPSINNQYEVMIGIPTKTDVEEQEPFKRKKMILGYILVGDVQGGMATVAAAEKRMADYAFDHQKTAPAIPFQSLITDRMQEKDTSKWISRFVLSLSEADNLHGIIILCQNICLRSFDGY